MARSSGRNRGVGDGGTDPFFLEKKTWASWKNRSKNNGKPNMLEFATIEEPTSVLKCFEREVSRFSETHVHVHRCASNFRARDRIFGTQF